MDLTISHAIQSINNPFFDTLMRFLTDMGYLIPGFFITLAISLSVFFWQGKKLGLLVLISTLGAQAISIVVKYIVARPRPDPLLIHQIEKFTYNDSFPSGHTLFAVGLFGILIYIFCKYLKKGLLRYMLIFSCFLVIILMGLSRIYFGAHWFSDVLGAYLIGIIWLYLIIFLSSKLNYFKKS